MKRWTVSRADEGAVKKITSATDLPKLLAEIMAARGYNTVESLAEFFNGGELSDPFLLADMQNAVDAINSAVDAGERICIFGDYDCDGITSAAVLYGYLMSMGADVDVMIPERGDGYGLSVSAVGKMKESGASLIITVDNGITAVDEAEKISELGMKLVVTDHHQPTETLPKALAVVDPHRRDCPSPFKQLCGAGVVLKLCAALDGGDCASVCEQYCDLVAIATIADVVPLVGENRTIVSYGLRLLKNTENPGIISLLEKSGVDLSALTASRVAFTIAPRINAASRFGSPVTALNMLIAEDESAAEYAEELCALNSRRREAESGIAEEITKAVDSDPSLLEKRVLVVAGKGWHRGIIGIVAARLTEIFERPAIVLSIDENGEACGSARSVGGFNIFKCFDYCRDILIKYGGHELAGGLTLKESDIPALRKLVEEYSAESCRETPRPTLNADKLISGGDLTVENAESLSRLEPCGQLNPEPIFALSGAEITAVYPLKNGEHTKLELLYDGARVQLLMFGKKTEELEFSVGDKIDVMANMSLGEYKGVKSVSLRAVDCRLHGVKQEPYFAAEEAYLKFRRGEKLSPEILRKGDPTRSELVEVYKYISKRPITLEGLCARLRESVNPFRLRIIVDAFCDVGLAKYYPSSGRIFVLKPTARADIDSAETLVKLRGLL